jgi:hypothetical protein
MADVTLETTPADAKAILDGAPLKTDGGNIGAFFVWWTAVHARPKNTVSKPGGTNARRPLTFGDHAWHPKFAAVSEVNDLPVTVSTRCTTLPQ